MRGRSDTVELVIGRIAARQHGVVTRTQLLEAGVSSSGIDRRVHKGTLLGAHRGVFRVGHKAPSTEASYLAAVLACGDGAVLSGRAAGHLWRLLKGRPPRPEVTAPGRRRIAGVAVRRCRSLGNHEHTVFRDIPVTSVSRTLVDLAGALDEDELGRACHEASVLYGVTRVAPRPNAPGAGRLTRVLAGDAPVTLSALERGFLGLLREAGLPLPQTNRRVDAHWVDCRWPERRLTVELDSYRFHGSRRSWERDRRREREAYARGDDFRRYTWADVFEQPRATMAELRAWLR